MKKILFVVTGGVAIYKSLSLIRLLRKADYEVRCVMTEPATKLIQPLLFETISCNPVRTDTFARKTGNDIEHIGLSRWADLAVIVPATANIIGKMANGIADDLASVTLLACNKKIMAVPSMNPAMWENSAFQRNLKQLEKDGVVVLEPAIGKVACGEHGKGRLPEPDEIFNHIKKYFKK